MRRLGYVACAVLILGLWLPWGKLSIGLFGGSPTGLGDINGQDIGTDVLNLPVGWITAIAGAVGAYALSHAARGTAVAAGLVALLVTGYSLLAIPGTESTTANGQDVSGAVNGQVSLAWGVFAVTAAAVVLLVNATRLPRSLADAAAKE